MRGYRRAHDPGRVAPAVVVTLPLADVRVLAVEQFGAGPWGTLQLADLGADVIKIEDPAAGGDVSRYVPPYQADEDSIYFEAFNRNKRSVSLDLRHPRGREVLLDLVAGVDAVFSNLRGDQPERLGLTYDQLAAANPRIVCCSLSAFGMTGPRRTEGGYDNIMQGLAGWMSLTGAPDDPPTKSGLSLVDFSGGYVAAIAMLAGLWRARRDRLGCDCDLSLFETAISELNYVGTWAATRGYVPERRRNSAHPSIVPFQSFRTADGWIVVACPKQKFWRLLCDALEQPALASDPRFADFAGRDENREALLEILDEAFADRTSGDVLEALARRGIPSAPVNTVEEALRDPQAQAREAVVEIEHPRFGTVRHLATPLRVGDEPKPLRRGPLRGEDTVEVLTGVCGYSRERIDELLASGALGAADAVEAGVDGSEPGAI